MGVKQMLIPSREVSAHVEIHRCLLAASVASTHRQIYGSKEGCIPSDDTLTLVQISGCFFDNVIALDHG